MTNSNTDKRIVEIDAELAALDNQDNEAAIIVADFPKILDLIQKGDAKTLKNDYGILTEEEANAVREKISVEQSKYNEVHRNIESQKQILRIEKSKLEDVRDWNNLPDKDKPLVVRLNVAHTDSNGTPLYTELFELWIGRGYSFAGELVCSGNVRILTFTKGK